MKKIMISMLSALVVVGAVLAAPTSTTETFTNSMGQVFEVTTTLVGDGTSLAYQPAAKTIQMSATATPDQIGQMAVVAGSAAYVALNDTTFTPIPQFQVLVAATVGTDYVLTNLTPRSIGHMVYSVSNVLSAASGAGTTGTVAVAVGATVNDWIILK